jgi:predicted nucleic acid-binding protein
MYRVVLDPVVILRGLINPHSVCGILISEYAARYKAVFSAETGQALIFLPFHPMLVARFPRLARLNPRHIGRLFAHAEKVAVDLTSHANVVVATAVAAHADYLICEDPHLLAMQDKLPVRMLSAAAFVALLASEPSL